MKTRLFNVLAGVLLGVLLWQGDSIRAEAGETYTYQTKAVETEEGMKFEKQWYVGPWDALQELDGPPKSLDYATIYLYAEPEGETDAWLKGLNGDYQSCQFRVQIPNNGTVQIGSPENEVSINILDVMGGTVNVYGDLGASMVSFDYYVDTVSLNVYGDIYELTLGMQQERAESETPDYNVYIQGDIINKVSWIKTTRTEEQGTRYYRAFDGTAVVDGSVASGVIRELAWDDVAEMHVWYDSGTIENCATGTFKIQDGILADSVPVVEKEAVVGQYDFTYFVTTDIVNSEMVTRWDRYAYHKADGSHAFVQDWSQDKVPENSIIQIVGLAEPMVLDMDIAYLWVQNSGQHCPQEAIIDLTVNGDIKEFVLDLHRFNPITVNVEGNVESADICYRYNPDANVKVTGKVSNGLHRAIYPMGMLDVGKFTADNMQLIADGIWNSELLFYSLQEEDAIAFTPMNQENVTTALADNELDKEIVVNTAEGEKKLVKEATVLIEQTAEADLEQAEQAEEMEIAMDELGIQLSEADKEVISMEAVCGLDISVGTHYMDLSTGYSYADDPNYAAKEITQLQEGLPFTVKIPENVYDAEKKYSIIREHKNTDGTMDMEILKSTLEGDKISFQSDKFSTFMILATELGEKRPEVTPEPTPEATPEPTPEETPEPTPEATPEPTPEATPEPTPEVTPVPAPSPEITPETLSNQNPYAVPTTMLKIGSQQREFVKWLQTELVQAGYSITVDGVFGRNTRLALMDYQLRHGLQVDGICGNMTINSMLHGKENVVSGTNTYPVPRGIIRAGGGRRAEVLWLQTELAQAGYQLAIDGRFGRDTKAALMDYQLRHGLVVDGICGPKTIQSMLIQ